MGVSLKRVPIAENELATVYRGTEAGGRGVVVKVFEVATDEGSSSTLLLFRRELAALRLLADVDGVVDLVSSGSVEGAEYLVLADGGESYQDLIDEGRLDRQRVSAVVASAARTVGQCHHRGVIHGDIKPGNILVGDDGDPVLIDFGSAIVEGNEDDSRADLLTPFFAAPESFDSPRVVTSASDVYSLGATLVGMLFAVSSDARIDPTVPLDPPKACDALADHGYPPGFITTIQAATAASPSARYETAEDLAADLESLLVSPGGGKLSTVNVEDAAIQAELVGATSEGAASNWSLFKRYFLLVLAPLILVSGLIVWWQASLSTDELTTASVNEDGSGDFQSVEDAVSALPAGSTISLGSGTFVVSEPLLLDKSIRIVGQGRSETQIVGRGSTGVIHAVSIDLTLRGLTISYDGGFEGVDAVHIDSVELEMIDVEIIRATGDGLASRGASRGTVQSSTFRHNDEAGLAQYDTSSLEISRDTTSELNQTGFAWWDDSAGPALDTKAINNLGDGYVVAGNAAPDLSGNDAIDNSGSGFQWSEQAAISASANEAVGNTSFGYLMTGSATGDLTDNTATDSGSSGFAWLDESSGNASGNRSIENRFSGFVVRNTAAPVLSGNLATDNTQAGFRWADNAGGSSVGNTATENHQDGFFASGDGTLDAISENKAFDNRRHGFSIEVSVEEGLIENRATGNDANGFQVSLPEGLTLKISMNWASGNDGYGFATSFDLAESTRNTSFSNELGSFEVIN